jgi:hypothetical protein
MLPRQHSEPCKCAHNGIEVGYAMIYTARCFESSLTVAGDIDYSYVTAMLLTLPDNLSALLFRLVRGLYLVPTVLMVVLQLCAY